MSSIDGLLLLLAVVYLVECAAWVSREAVPFRQDILGRWRHTPPAEWGGHDRNAFAFSGPLPPLAPLILAQTWPIAITAAGVSGTAGGGRLFAWEELREMRIRGRLLLAGDEPLSELASPLAAHQVGELLERLAALEPKQREKEARSAVRGTLDAEAARRRHAQYRAASWPLAISTNALAVLLLAVVPASFHFRHLAASWPVTLACGLGLWALVVLDFARAYRELHPHERRRRHVLMMAVSPLAAMRARDVAARDALILFHPLAVARALLDATRFEAFAKKALAQMRFPLAGAGEWDGLLVEEAERFLRHEGLDPEALLEPPPREGPESLSYCERCRAQYTLREGSCHACGGRALRAYEIAGGSGGSA